MIAFAVNGSRIDNHTTAAIDTDPTQMNQNNSRVKVTMLVNIISPARIPIYSGLAKHFDLLILYGGTESNRDSWHDLEKTIPHAKVKRAWGWQIQRTKQVKGKVFDRQYLHITPGFIWHLLRFRPDAIIAGEMGVRTLLALAYGTLWRKSVWVWWGGTLHTERTIGKPRRVLRFLVSRWARQWISYGQTSTEYLASLGISRNRILQIQNAVDEKLFSVDTEAEFNLHPHPVLLHVGQFIARKGIDLFLKAAADLQKRGHEFSLLFVGSGPDRQALEQLASDLHLQNAHFHSSRKPEKMPSVYRSGDVLVLPTLEDVWGLVANEAILSGLPVLCSKYAGCAEELFPQENIFDPENPRDFVAKLREAIGGRFPKPDRSRIMTTQQILDRMIYAIEASVRDKSVVSARLSEGAN